MSVEISRINAIVCDLIFGSKIQEYVKSAAGLEYSSLRSIDEIRERLSDAKNKVDSELWILNLAAKPNEPTFVEQALPLLLQQGVKLICYAPHVEEHRIQWAQKAGARSVVARGALLRELGQALS